MRLLILIALKNIVDTLEPAEGVYMSRCCCCFFSNLNILLSRIFSSLLFLCVYLLCFYANTDRMWTMERKKTKNSCIASFQNSSSMWVRCRRVSGTTGTKEFTDIEPSADQYCGMWMTVICIFFEIYPHTF